MSVKNKIEFPKEVEDNLQVISLQKFRKCYKIKFHHELSIN